MNEFQHFQQQELTPEEIKKREARIANYGKGSEKLNDLVEDLANVDPNNPVSSRNLMEVIINLKKENDDLRDDLEHIAVICLGQANDRVLSERNRHAQFRYHYYMNTHRRWHNKLYIADKEREVG